uniref:Uncharacterized protein n=1 Tax=Aureoumbra lagunensis TaxID=44058 RepID=A0A7S3K4Y7_9STRA
METCAAMCAVVVDAVCGYFILLRLTKMLTGRLPVCICCGPQLNNVCPDYCCYAESCFQRQCASARVGAKESCCDCCDCCYQMFAPRYAGCKTLCCHCTCVGCPAGCENCCCCQEERLMMDGDLQIIPTGGSGDVPLSDATEST